MCRRIVNLFYWMLDYCLGMFLLVCLFVGSFLGLVTLFQASVLFNTRYARQYLTQEQLKGTEIEKLVRQDQERCVWACGGGGAKHVWDLLVSKIYWSVRFTG